MWSHTEQFLMTSLANKKLHNLRFQNKNMCKALWNFLDEKGVSYPNAALSPARQVWLLGNTGAHQQDIGTSANAG